MIKHWLVSQKYQPVPISRMFESENANLIMNVMLEYKSPTMLAHLGHLSNRCKRAGVSSIPLALSASGFYLRSLWIPYLKLFSMGHQIIL